MFLPGVLGTLKVMIKAQNAVALSVGELSQEVLAVGKSKLVTRFGWRLATL